MKISELIEIIQGDALAELKKIESHSVDLLIADPPYNLGKDYGNNHDLKGFQDYLEFSLAWLQDAHRVLKSTGTLYVFMGVRCISYLYDILDQQFTFHLDAVRVLQKYYRVRNNMRGANPGDVWQFLHVHYCNENRQNHPNTLVGSVFLNHEQW